MTGRKDAKSDQPSNPLEKTGHLPYVPVTPAPAQTQADFNAIKLSLENLRKVITKKYQFTMAISLIPGQASPLFEEDEQLPKDVVDTKPLHIMVIIPEE